MKVPEDFETVIEKLITRKWILSSLKSDEDTLYNPANFVLWQKKDNIKFQLLIDRNIFHYIIKSYVKPVDENHRIAIGLVSFCQFADIYIDASLALHEKLKVSNVCLDESLDELDLFYRIDDSPNRESLVKYAAGLQNRYEINQSMPRSEKLKVVSDWYTKYEKIKGWDSQYVITLKIVELFTSQMANLEKMKSLLEWMYSKFRFSAVASYYGLLLFSSKNIKGLMKYKPLSKPESRVKQIVNMTWDLFVCDVYMKQLLERNESVEYLFATADKALKELVTVIVGSSTQNPKDYFETYFKSETDMELVTLMEESQTWKGPRQFEGKFFKVPNQKFILIKELEEKLGISGIATNSC